MEKSITITIDGITDNTAPKAEDDDLDFTEDTSATKQFNVLGNDSDPEVDALSVNTFTTKNGTYGTFSQPATNGDIQYAFANNAAAQKLKAGATATETATYSVSDGSLSSNEATLTVTITGVNDAPEAGNVAGGLYENQTGGFLRMNAVAVASDVDTGDTITLKSVEAASTGDLRNLYGPGRQKCPLLEAQFDIGLLEGRRNRSRIPPHLRLRTRHGASEYGHCDGYDYWRQRRADGGGTCQRYPHSRSSDTGRHGFPRSQRRGWP